MTRKFLSNVETLRQEGRDEEAFKLMGEYLNQLKQESSSQLQSIQNETNFERFWSEYKSHRPEIFSNLSELDQRVYKAHIKSYELNKLADSDDQVGYLDSILKPVAERSKKFSSDEPAPEFLDASSSSSLREEPKKETKEASAEVSFYLSTQRPRLYKKSKHPTPVEMSLILIQIYFRRYFCV